MLKLLIVCATISTIFAEDKWTFYCEGSRNLSAIINKFETTTRRGKSIEVFGPQYRLFLENTKIMNHNLELVSQDVCGNKNNQLKIDAFLAEYKKAADILMVASYDKFMRFQVVRKRLYKDLFFTFFHHKEIMDYHLGGVYERSNDRSHERSDERSDEQSNERSQEQSQERSNERSKERPKERSKERSNERSNEQFYAGYHERFNDRFYTRSYERFSTRSYDRSHERFYDPMIRTSTGSYGRPYERIHPAS